MNHGNENSPRLPLVRLALISPFLQELQRRGIDAGAVLSEVELSIDAVRCADTFVVAGSVYAFAEAAASAADDPHFGLGLGEKLDLYSWPGFAELVANAASVADFLVRLVLLVAEHGTSVTHVLEVHGESARVAALRRPAPARSPAQIDGFGVGLWAHALRQSAGNNWDPRQVLLTVCQPGALPSGYLGATIAKGGNDGPSVRFPSRWLLEPLARTSFARERLAAAVLQKPATSLTASLRQALLPQLHRTELSVEQAAKICGSRKSTLARKLKAEGTTLADEIAALKRDCATSALADSERSVAEIAASLGFSDPTNFARWFRQQTGQSPRAYRKCRQTAG